MSAGEFCTEQEIVVNRGGCSIAEQWKRGFSTREGREVSGERREWGIIKAGLMEETIFQGGHERICKDGSERLALKNQALLERKWRGRYSASESALPLVWVIPLLGSTLLFSYCLLFNLHFLKLYFIFNWHAIHVRIRGYDVMFWYILFLKSFSFFACPPLPLQLWISWD